MKTILSTLLFLLLLLLGSCNTKEKSSKNSEQLEADITEIIEPTKAESLVAETIKAHGGELYDTAHYQFVFRNKTYSFKNAANLSHYTVTSTAGSETILDELKNGILSRSINGASVSLSEKDVDKYTEALNSVVYFASLPHKLKDKAVNKTYEGRASIKGQEYDLLGVSFDQEGGGKDYDDKFLYWINSESKTIDYLAYSYSSNDGGVRFRSAFNPRTVNGIRFQDYINYKVPLGTALKDISKLYEEGNLEELSKIITEEVKELE